MSHHSDEGAWGGPGSDSFWEPGNYKKTTRRIEDGSKLCSELAALVAERAEIEKGYAKSLKAWAIKWNNSIEKGEREGKPLSNRAFVDCNGTSNCAKNLTGKLHWFLKSPEEKILLTPLALLRIGGGYQICFSLTNAGRFLFDCRGKWRELSEQE